MTLSGPGGPTTGGNAGVPSARPRQTAAGRHDPYLFQRRMWASAPADVGELLVPQWVEIDHDMLGRTMPCDGAWPAERADVFARWVATGMSA